MPITNTLPYAFPFLNKSPDQLSEEFNSIPNKAFKDEKEARISPEHSIGTQFENSNLNRYPHIIANDRTRVKLDLGFSRYINENHCLKNRVIIAQEPMNIGDNKYYGHHIDFYQMLYANGCNAIAMLSADASKECPYLSSEYDDELAYSGIHPFAIEARDIRKEEESLSSIEQRDLNSLRELGVKITKVIISHQRYALGSKPLTHYHFPNWKDGDPTTAKVVAILTKILLKATEPILDNKPVLHCRTGIGPSGVLAAVMGVYAKIQQSYSEVIFTKHTPNFSYTLVKDVATSLRSERRGCVCTVEEYQTVYDAVKILAQEGFAARGY
jgi:protein tyrosine phosphatase